MKKIFYTLLAFIIFSFQFSICEAQTWQWGVTQGSNSNTDRVEDMATDIYGNIYLVSRVGKNAPYAASVALPNGKGLGDRHTMLVSYDCNGKYRWSKIIGAVTAQTTSLRVTQTGNVYLFGLVAAGTGYSIFYDSDTTTPTTTYQQRMSLICFDTSGNYKWLRRPDSVVTTIYDYHPMSMDIDELGNAYCLVTMPLGSKILGSSLTIPSTAPFKGLGAYVLKYNPSGILLSVTMLKDFSYTYKDGIITSNAFIKYNRFNGGYIISVNAYPNPTSDSLFVKGLYNDHGIFLGSFMSDGTLKWFKADTDTVGYNGIVGPVSILDSGNIILGGTAVHGNNFNGHSFNNPLCTSGIVLGMPFIMKMDSNGVRKWSVNGGVGVCTSNNTVQGFSVNNMYAIISSTSWLKNYFGDPYKDTVVVNHPKTGGPGQDGWYAIVDIKTGKTVKLGTARGDGFLDGITGLLFKGDDLYMAGHTESGLAIDSTFNLTKKAGTSIDVFLAKYSFKCGCVGAPLATYSYNSSSNTFTFTGTTPADSVTWDFGDGSTGKGLSIFHSYAKKGKYKVCATLWSPTCGPVYYCDSINVTLSIPDAVAYRNLRIYPNPTKDYLTIDGLPANTELSLYSIVGQKISTKVALSTTEQIDLNGLSAGLYLIQIKDEDGNVYSAKVMKE